jgi:glucuronide carrier protein
VRGMSKYKLTDARHARILEEIQSRRERGDGPHTSGAAVESADGTGTAPSPQPLAAPAN